MPAHSPPMSIKNRMDVLDYIIEKEKLDLVGAISLYLFHLNFINRLRDKENNVGRRFTSAEIDEFVYELYSVKEIDGYKEEATKIIKDYRREVRQFVYVDRMEEILGLNKGIFHSTLLNKGAWQGFFGNMITLLAGILFSIFVAGYESKNIGKSTLEFANRCLSPIIHPGKLNDPTN